MSKVGIVTVTYNSSKVIHDFMKSLLNQQYQDFFLYVVDNDSKDSTLKLIKKDYQDSRTQFIENKINFGVAKGNNQGIEKALDDGCELILLINNDVVFDSWLVGSLVNEIENGQTIDMLVPKILFHDEPNKIWFGGGKFVGMTNFPKHIGWGEIDSKDQRNTEIEYAPTCCMMIKKSVFEKIGYMDEKYFVYVDDVDFCLRAKKHGLGMYYTSKLELLHKVSSLTGLESNFSLFYGTRNRVYYVKKHSSTLLWFVWLMQKQFRILAMLFKSKNSFEQYFVCQKGFLNGIAM